MTSTPGSLSEKTAATPDPAPIPALISYYRRLREDPNETVAPFGFSVQKISFCLVIELDGELHAIQDTRHQVNDRLLPAPMIVPGQTKPSGAGLNPGFLWDNAQYMMGFKPNDKKPERTARAFQAFRGRHLDLKDRIEDEHFLAVCRFLETWDPAGISNTPGHEFLEELAGGFGVFQVRGRPGYVHDRDEVLDYWQQQIETDSASESGDLGDVGQSLVSGRAAKLARLHEPKIKGVVGAQSSGSVLVGFNEDAYTSYGKTKSFNAPVAEDEAFEYCTALNQLLSRPDHRARLGDMTAVFWSERPTAAEGLVAFFLGGEPSRGHQAEDPGVTERVRGFVDALRRGAPHGGLHDTAVPFYILGLSPNSARISVRFWLAGTVGAFADRLARHVRELEITGDKGDEPLTIRRLLRETAREARDIPPQLAGEVARAILSGGHYPETLYSAVLRRIRADRDLNRNRAAILKACLIRNHHQEVPVSLDQEHPESAYQMGRLFAALEKTQQDALPGLNKTIKDGYFTTASATPAAVFPRLIQLHQHHIEKLEGGLKVNREKLIQEICDHIDQFPAHLPLKQQGLFHIGYYHQRHAFFIRKDRDEETAEVATASEETTNA